MKWIKKVSELTAFALPLKVVYHSTSKSVHFWLYKSISMMQLTCKPMLAKEIELVVSGKGKVD